MNRIKLIGLTGQTGTGKSTVSAILARSGFAVISADALVAEIYATNPACLRAVAASFGQDIIRQDGSLDRPLLASRAFADKESTALLGALVHPFVIAETLKRLKKLSGAAVLDAPQLFESDIDAVCDAVISVTAPEYARLERIMSRDGVTAKQALARMGAQFSEAFFRAHSDYVIENNGDLAELEEQVRKVAGALRTEVR